VNRRYGPDACNSNSRWNRRWEWPSAYPGRCRRYRNRTAIGGSPRRGHGEQRRERRRRKGREGGEWKEKWWWPLEERREKSVRSGDWRSWTENEELNRETIIANCKGWGAGCVGVTIWIPSLFLVTFIREASLWDPPSLFFLRHRLRFSYSSLLSTEVVKKFEYIFI